ncbi:hypothetical protein SARC_02621 [Sphaeroforma arctica JP610]|uniref:Uncharacterized protein n=1 Tax=Sphaeroforma arctica JP610 TaxID=667725 RepID=A0A0L0G843_9EUKA|nr:hypothetical protein SARC_02621 [Sphaeroforma arctica JP610]KNC85202.1 hypothetical protein SARC_02621 [Sphaeroforma arctica JP610]|eukprot:XP_014159104.1 hypothetical protein SARC_02621 [Sphaeroforma arctica JP610]
MELNLEINLKNPRTDTRDGDRKLSLSDECASNSSGECASNSSGEGASSSRGEGLSTLDGISTLWGDLFGDDKAHTALVDDMLTGSKAEGGQSGSKAEGGQSGSKGEEGQSGSKAQDKKKSQSKSLGTNIDSGVFHELKENGPKADPSPNQADPSPNQADPSPNQASQFQSQGRHAYDELTQSSQIDESMKVQTRSPGKKGRVCEMCGESGHIGGVNAFISSEGDRQFPSQRVRIGITKYLQYKPIGSLII